MSDHQPTDCSIPAAATIAAPGHKPFAPDLRGKIAVVAGATRGAGRGIAQQLGAAGATVYCCGRSTRAQAATPGRTETIEETAALVTAAGGCGIAVRTDFLIESEVAALFARVRDESGRLDVLVNDVWGGDALTEWQPFWTLDAHKGLRLLDQAVRTHLLSSRYAAPVLVAQRSGLIVEITDGDHRGYRGSLYYDLAKMAAIRMAQDMAQELAAQGVTALAVTPGFLRSEAMLERFGVSEANWQDAAARVRGFEMSETPAYVGRAIAALAADPEIARKNGGVYASWTLAEEYGYTDIDGRRPHWGRYVRDSVQAILDRGGPADADERFWLEAWVMQLRDEPDWQDLCARAAALR